MATERKVTEIIKEAGYERFWHRDYGSKLSETGKLAPEKSGRYPGTIKKSV